MISLEVSGAVGLLTTGTVEVLKHVRRVPLVAGQTKRIRTVAAVFAFLGNVGYALADGNVDVMTLVANTVASFLVSWAAFKGIISTK